MYQNTRSMRRRLRAATKRRMTSRSLRACTESVTPDHIAAHSGGSASLPAIAGHVNSVTQIGSPPSPWRRIMPRAKRRIRSTLAGRLVKGWIATASNAPCAPAA